MAVNVKVKKKRRSENDLSILRRFRNRVRSANIVRAVRSGRFYERSSSKFEQKKNKLRSIEKQKERERLYKLGKI